MALITVMSVITSLPASAAPERDPDGDPNNTIDVVPANALADGQLVTVTGAGFTPNSSGTVRVCTTGDAIICANSLGGITTNAGGGFSANVNVPRSFTQGPTVNCAVSACRLVAQAGTFYASHHLTFGGAGHRPPADFDGNGTSDVSVYRASNGSWYVQGGLAAAWGQAGDTPVPADYDGNGTADVAVYRPSNGVWYVQNGATVGFGTNGDIPVPGDYNGDGTMDVAVFRPSNGVWYVSGGATTGWGANGDVPVPGDYNGDGRTDLAVYRPSTGVWYVNGGATLGWGTAGDIPVPGDYDGDGDTDIAVFRPSNGVWYVSGGASAAWGANGDVPVPGDYNGDGRTDMAVFRPATGQWFVKNGASVTWGTTGDIALPIPAAIRLAMPNAPIPSRYGAVASDDGMYVAFASAASDLVDSDTNGVNDVFVFDRDAGGTIRASVSAGGGQANGSSRSVSISASIPRIDEDMVTRSDPGLVAFESLASNLVPGDGNGVSDVFVRNMLADTTSLVSMNTSGQPGNGSSFGSAISADGRYVAFSSAASDLVPGDANGQVDVFVRDRVAGTTSLVSITSSGTQGNGPSGDPVISGDGRYVAFTSLASNLVAGDTNAAADIFVRDRSAGTTNRVSIGAASAQANGASVSPTISSDGRYVAFSSTASNLVVGDTNSTDDVFLRDRTGGITARMSVSSSGAPGNGPSVSPSISADGRFVAFESTATNLANGDSNNVSDAFEVEVASGWTARLSIDDVLGQGNAPSYRPAISYDGTFAAFDTFASNFDDDINGALDVYLHIWTDLTNPIPSSPIQSGSMSAVDGTSATCGPQSAPAGGSGEAASGPVDLSHKHCVVAQNSQSKSTTQARAAADAPIGPTNCDDGEVNAGQYPVNIKTNGLTQPEIDAIKLYARKANSWLSKAALIKGGPIRIKGTKGVLRRDASAAARAERQLAMDEGRPYSGQVGHGPDTALTGQANPPCGWIDMPGKSNQKAGGVLGPRVGKFITHFLVDGLVP